MTSWGLFVHMLPPVSEGVITDLSSWPIYWLLIIPTTPVVVASDVIIIVIVVFEISYFP